MKILIDNNQRVFLVKRQGYFTRQYFCNLNHIPDILKKELEPHDVFTISEFWNGKFKKIGKKALNEMFQANQIKYKIA